MSEQNAVFFVKDEIFKALTSVHGFKPFKIDDGLHGDVKEIFKKAPSGLDKGELTLTLFRKGTECQKFGFALFDGRNNFTISSGIGSLRHGLPGFQQKLTELALFTQSQFKINTLTKEYDKDLHVEVKHPPKKELKKIMRNVTRGSR
jgi:hypothetical protein